LRAPAGRASAYAAVLVLALVWGYTWVVIKIATQYASPYVVAGGRIALGAAILFVALAATGRSLRPTPLGPTIVLGLLQTTGFSLFQTLAVSMAGAGKVSVLAYTMPFWVAILAWPFLGERIGGLRWVALSVAAVGLGLVVAPLPRGAIAADALAIAAGLSWAASAVWAKRLRARHDVDLLGLTAWQLLWGAIPLIVIMLAVPERIVWTPTFVAAMAFLAIVGTSFAWFLWLFILSRLPAGVAGLASLATPVVGVTAAALQLHEIPSRTELIGMSLIVAALGLNAASARESPRKRQYAPDELVEGA
jgi:drug/metabolite transporter (DMT)-like permease